MNYRFMLSLAALTIAPSVALASGCTGYAIFNDCTRKQVMDWGCTICPVTCHDYDDEDAGDAATDADAATDMDAAMDADADTDDMEASTDMDAGPDADAAD